MIAALHNSASASPRPANGRFMQPAAPTGPATMPDAIAS